MPELPEVETVRKGLENHLKDRVIVDVELRRKDLRFPFPNRFDEMMTHVQVPKKSMLNKVRNTLTLTKFTDKYNIYE